MSEPRYTHHCKGCVCLGRASYQDDEDASCDKPPTEYDIYHHAGGPGGGSLLGRYGNNVEDYISAPAIVLLSTDDPGNLGPLSVLARYARSLLRDGTIRLKDSHEPA